MSVQSTIYRQTSRVSLLPQHGKANNMQKPSKEKGLRHAIQAALLMEEGGHTDGDSVYCLLQQCVEERDLGASHLMHSLLVYVGLDSVGVFADNFISIVAHCESLFRARVLFYKVLVRKIHSWNAIIMAHIEVEAFEESIQLYCNLRKDFVAPNNFTFIALIKACKHMRGEEPARLLHEHILGHKLESDKLIESALVDMYAKCGFLEDAHAVFERLVHQNVVTWNAMISGYCMHGNDAFALELFEKMEQSHMKPNELTFACILKVCGNVGTVGNCLHVHDRVIQEAFESNNMVSNSIIDMYMRCGDLETAQSLFTKFQHQDAVPWNVLIARHVQNGSFISAFELFDKMHQMPDVFTFSSILQACGLLGSLKCGSIIHSLIIKFGLEANEVVKRMIVDMYSKCGNMQEAYIILHTSPHFDVTSWTSIIAGYVQHGDAVIALNMFETILHRDFPPNDVTYSWVLKACAHTQALRMGMLIHHMMILSGLKINEVSGSALVGMYAICKHLSDAQKTFTGTTYQDLVLWNTLISAYVEAGDALSALNLVDRMQSNGIKPDNYTFSCILRACTELGDLKLGRLMHDNMIRSNIKFDQVMGNSIVDMYAKFGGIKELFWVFGKLPTRDTVSWNSLLGGYTQYEHGLWALELMQLEGIILDNTTLLCALKVFSSFGALNEGRMVHHLVIRNGLELDIAIGSKLVDMYIKCGSLEEGQKTFNKMPIQSLLAWNAVITGYIVQGDMLFAIELFMKLQIQGNEPNLVTYIHVLKACTRLGAILLGKLVNAQIIESALESDVIIHTALIDMYGKCGNVLEASNLFEHFPSQELEVWNAIITVYAHQGDCLQVESCLAKMPTYGLKPDDRTYSSVLAACSHAGKVMEGLHHFDSMTKEYGLLPTVEHITCVVDLLGRSGLVHVAEKFLDSSPALPEILGWRTVLSACQTHGADLNHCVQSCYHQSVTLDSTNSGGYVMMSNIFADAGFSNNAHEIQEQRINQGAWKKPGKACIEVNRSVHQFVVGCSENSQMAEVVNKVLGLSRIMHEEGYVPQLALVLQLSSSE